MMTEETDVNFLCQNHKAQLCDDADRAEAGWHHAMVRARRAVQNESWDKAVMCRGHSRGAPWNR